MMEGAQAMTVDEAFEVIRKSIQCDDNEAWDALDVIIARLNELEEHG